MREFFRGWRRKVGVVTLVLALVFMGGCVRSQAFVDTLTFLEIRGEQPMQFNPADMAFAGVKNNGFLGER